MPTRSGKIQTISLPAQNRLRASSLRQHIDRATQYIARAHKIPKGKILVVLGGDREMRRIKKLFWAKRETSDVVSFSYPDNQDPRIEIIINVEQAKRQTLVASRLALEKEIAFLYIHALLHALGWDDKAPKQRKEMIGIGRAILKKIYGSR